MDFHPYSFDLVPCLICEIIPDKVYEELIQRGTTAIELPLAIEINLAQVYCVKRE